MATYKFTGRVLPAFKEFTIVGNLNVHLEDEVDPPLKIIIDASVGITKGVIEVTCESNLYGSDNYDGHVDVKAKYLAQSIVNCYAFAKGMKLDVIFENVVKPDGIKYNIQAYRADLEPLVTALKGPHEGVDITSMLWVVLRNPTIFALFQDLVGSLDSSQTLVNCARAIDGIRISMTPEEDKKSVENRPRQSQYQ